MQAPSDGAKTESLVALPPEKASVSSVEDLDLT